MTIKRIVWNIAVDDLDATRAFYTSLFGLETAMDIGWIATLSSGETQPVQMSIATQGGSDTAVPDASIEVADVDAIHARAVKLGYKIAYGPVDEPWGVRRFYLRDPAGKLLNILCHQSEECTT